MTDQSYLTNTSDNTIIYDSPHQIIDHTVPETDNEVITTPIEISSELPEINPQDLTSRAFTIVGKGDARRIQRLQKTNFPLSPVEPTGIFCRANEQITIHVSGSNGIGAYIGAFNYPMAGHRPTLRQLNPGNNTISSQTDGLLYFNVEHEIGLSIHVNVTAGGVPSPLFILGKHTQADFQQMLDTFTESTMIELKTDRVLVTVSREFGLSHLNHRDPITVMQLHDRIVELQDEFSGLAANMPHAKDRPAPHYKVYTEDQNPSVFMWAGPYSTGYGSNQIRYILVDNLLRHHGWGPWYQQGHVRQMPAWLWNVDSLTRATASIYSLYTERGITNYPMNRLEREGKYTAAFNYVNRTGAKDFDTEPNLERSIMFWQLDLAFGKNFYPRLHQAYRELPNDQIPHGGSGTNTGDAGRQLFIRMASQTANRNLRTFFERWGIPITDETLSALNQLPPLEQQIWLGRDTAPIIEWTVPELNAPHLIAENITNNAVSLLTQGLPSSFDPRIVFGRNPATSNQHGTNNCWIHSAVASAELNHLKTTGNVLKFSEPFYRYLVIRSNNHPGGGGFIEFNPYAASGHSFNSMANTSIGMWTIMNYMLNWQGPILYNQWPYEDGTRWAPFNAPRYPISRAYTTPAIHVQGYETILTTADLGGPANLAERTRLLKEAIYNNGSFVTGFNSHSMSFVGWNDEIVNSDGSRGAYLQKESYGPQGEYRWIRYNNPGFNQAVTMSINHVEATGNFTQNYFHTRVLSGRRRITGVNSVTLANVFIARTANESLDAVGFSTLHPNTRFEIWVNPNGSGLDQNSLIRVGEGIAEKPGFRTVRIQSRTLGAVNSQFAVAIRYILPNGVNIFDFEAQDTNSQQGPNAAFNGTAPRQSFINITSGLSGVWTDLHDTRYPTVLGGAGRGVNVPIRAYTGATSGGSVTNTTIHIAPTNPASINVGDLLQFTANVINGVGTTTWNASNPSVANVSNTGLLTGLAPGTTQITAVNNNVSSNSISVTVNEGAQPPAAPTNLHTMGTISEGNVGLMWEHVTNADRYDVYRSTPTSTVSLLGTTTSNQYTDQTAVAGTTYYYYVIAVNAAGQSNPSSTITINVPAVITPEPPTEGTLNPPTNLRITNPTQTSLTLAWNAAQTDVNINRYDIYRNQVKIAEVAGNVLTYTDQGLIPGTSYQYTVRSHAASEHSNTATGTTSSNVITPPVLQAPTNLRASGQTQNSITLNWNLPSSIANIQGYRVYRNNNLVHTTTGNTITQFTDTGLAAGTNFTYRVASFNNQGSSEVSTGDLNTSTIASPQPTGGLTFSIAGEGSTRQNLRVTNRTGANIPTLWRIQLSYTGGNPSLEWPARWGLASNGSVSTTVNGALNNNGSVTIPMGVSSNTRIINVTVNDNIATRE